MYTDLVFYSKKYVFPNNRVCILSPQIGPKMVIIRCRLVYIIQHFLLEVIHRAI